MKKLLLTAAAVFAFGLANAQETKFGVKAGLNMADLGGDDADGLDSKVSFQLVVSPKSNYLINLHSNQNLFILLKELKLMVVLMI